MTAKENGSCAAYPEFKDNWSVQGLSKRELFAAMVLQGLMAADDARSTTGRTPEQLFAWRKSLATEDAKTCVIWADALLQELSK